MPERRPASALALVERLNACHDLAPWTNDMARAWWATMAPRVRTDARRHHRGAGSSTSPGSVTSLSYLRPKVPSKAR